VLKNIKKSNYGYRLLQLLKQENRQYFYYFEPIKSSFGKYDEGVAILSKFPLQNIESFYLSKQTNYASWKTRKALSGTIQLGYRHLQFITTHLGWTDEVEVYEDQFSALQTKIKKDHICLIGGDFNITPKSSEYTNIISSDLYDLYGLNPKHLFDPTHQADIDIHQGKTRIDYIFCNQQLEVLDRKILFEKPSVSDHFGVYLEIKL
jgi:maltose 6'-phosphate phosphatase